MKPSDWYHTGVVVTDLADATKRLTAAAGYTWTNPIEFVFDITTADGDSAVPFTFVYSLQAPHLELVQEVPGTVWTAMPGRAAHHLGYWTDDIGADAETLQQSGYRMEARPSGETLSQFAYLLDPAGVRIELVDRALFPDWPGFLDAMRA